MMISHLSDMISYKNHHLNYNREYWILKWLSGISTTPYSTTTTQIINCEFPKIPVNMIMNEIHSHQEYKPGSSVDFSCKAGHIMLGSNTIECLEGGSWSKLQGECSSEYRTILNMCRKKNFHIHLIMRLISLFQRIFYWKQ